MTFGPRRRPVLIFALACGAAGSTAARATPAFSAPATVGMIAPRESRLADDLRRELGASSFAVVIIEAKASDWRHDARRLPGGQRVHGVHVRQDEQSMTVFTRGARSGAVDARFEQAVGSGDRLARRRACLSVVEYLRVLTENEGPAGEDATAAATVGGAETPPAMPGVAQPGGGRAGEQTSGQRQSPRPPAEPAPPAASSPSTEVAAPSSQTTSEQVAAAEPPWVGTPTPYQRWKLGAGSTFGLAAARGGPTGHLQFLWYLPLDWRLAMCVRALWPVLGGQFRTGGNDVRTWTFNAAVSLQYLFERQTTRLQPFVGVSVGPRIGLTETTPSGALQSRETLTPSVSLGADAGFRYTLTSLVQLFLEAGLSHGWLIPGVRRADYEQEAANADAFHASFGVLFEI